MRLEERGRAGKERAASAKAGTARATPGMQSAERALCIPASPCSRAGTRSETIIFITSSLRPSRQASCRRLRVASWHQHGGTGQRRARRMLQARPPQARTHLQTLLRVFEGLHLHAQPVCVTLPSTFAPNVTNAAPAPAFGTPYRPPTAWSGPTRRWWWTRRAGVRA